MWFCSLFSGSSGNCIYVGTERTNILIDVGMSGKRIAQSLNSIGISPGEIDGILITHEHVDHVRGVGVMSRMFNIPIYVNNNTWKNIEGSIGRISENNIKIIKNNSAFFIGDIDIKSFKTPHDAVDPSGYSFFNGGKKISIATDIGHVSQWVFENIKDSDILLLESNHDEEMLKFGPYPYALKRRILSDIGHLSNKSAGEALIKLLTRKMVVVLGHLSQQNNYPELAYSTVLSVLKENGIDTDRDIRLEMAHRDCASSFLQI